MKNQNKTSESKKYNNIKLTIGIVKGIMTFLMILFFVYYGYSSELVQAISLYTSGEYLILLIFVFITGTAVSIIFAPLNYYTGFYLEHKYELSNQSFGAWLWEGAKGMMVGTAIGLPILFLFFWVLNTFASFWWLPFAVLMFLISVVLAQIVPILIIPIFYKVTPLDDGGLKEKILRLAEEAGMKVDNVYKFNMSKNTKKANAAFTGLGRTKRIILGDTLLENFSDDQIETVMAHELGHYKRKHIIKNIITGTLFSFLTLYLIAVFYEYSLVWFKFQNITQIAALPLLTIWAMLIGLIQQPVSNIISRKFEYEADEYAVRSTGKREAFISTLEKLTDQNMGDREPHPFVEWFFYSHPSIKNRTRSINNI